MIMIVLQILGSLGVFLYGMKVMSDGLQKSAGQSLQRILNLITGNRVFGVLTGLLITTIIQSSSATTVMVVSFVNAGLLSLQQAVGTIMGANIGTTVTTWIVSYLGFKVDISLIAVPIVGIGLPFMFAKNKRWVDLGDFIIGFGILFMGLGLLKNCVPDVSQYPHLMENIRFYTYDGLLSFLLLVAAGTVLTAIIQSSSAMMTITVAMAYKGWLDFPTAAALCLGENIGTTITANLAALGASVNARRAAVAHTLFNVFGVAWMTFVFPYAINLISYIAPWDTALQTNFPLNLALFHTLFNTVNTLILLPFSPYLAQAAEWIVRPGKRDQRQEYSLPYLASGRADAPQLNLMEARQETRKMAELTHHMFSDVIEVFFHPEKKLGTMVEAVKADEVLADKMQEEITKFLLCISRERINESAAVSVNNLMRVVHELENIADRCFNICLLAQRRYDKKITLCQEAEEDLAEYAGLVSGFIDFYLINMGTRFTDELLEQARQMEEQINLKRNEMRKRARRRMQEGSEVNAELIHLDVLRYLEHIGDNALNISEALRGMA